MSISATNEICSGTIEVMPLGDSITTGKYSGTDTSNGADSDDIGYRKDLWDLLNGDGYSIDFVGTVSNGLSYPFSDPQHEGHNGWRDDEIALNIYNNGGADWLSANPPDVILLHIGTNSLNPDESDVAVILDEIDEYEVNEGRSVIVIVARIIDQVPNNPTVNQFNSNVAGMVAARPDFNTEVFLVDMEDGAGLNYSIYPGNPSGDMIDNLHPYATGYTKMANVWKAKIDEIYASCGSNEPPVVTPVDPQINDEGETISTLPIQAVDPDGDALSYGAVNLPDGLNINHSTGEITGTLTDSAAVGSIYTVQVTASDGKPLGSTTISFDWTVNYINLSPSITNPGSQSDDEGDPVSININASDPDNDSLTYSATNLPQGLTINKDTGQITGTIGYQASIGSPHTVGISVTDDGIPSYTVSDSFTWTINNRNGTPEVTPISDQNHIEGTTLEPPLQINATDPDGDNLQYLASNLPIGLSINEINGQINGMIAFNASPGSPYNVEITVRDDGIPLESSKISFVWTVVNINGAPEIFNPGTLLNHPGDTINRKILANDPDGDDISFDEHGLPPNLNIDPISGVIAGKLPEWAKNGSPYKVDITVTDDGEPINSSSISFLWIVQDPGIYFPLIHK